MRQSLSLVKAAALSLWPGENPIGKRISVGGASATNEEESLSSSSPREVIGVARDTRSGWVWRADKSYLYLPFQSMPIDNSLPMYLVVRTVGDPKNVMAAVRAQADALGPDLLVSTRKLDDSLAFQMVPFRGIAALAGVLGLLSLLLASIGLYGVMAYVMSRRTRELGIRMALGARPVDLLKLMLGQGLRLIFVGIALGIIGGVAVSRLLAAALIDISPLDPVAFVSVSLLLASVATLATYIPARRAMKADPLAALRYGVTLRICEVRGQGKAR
ncbi:MAG: FtsX-like permease family protein [Pyrinomonadaceae bacterium]